MDFFSNHVLLFILTAFYSFAGVIDVFLKYYIFGFKFCPLKFFKNFINFFYISLTPYTVLHFHAIFFLRHPISYFFLG